MIIRATLFLTLLALFYYYCNDDNKSNQFRGPNDINMIEVPQDIAPSFMENTNTARYLNDSLYFLTSENIPFSSSSLNNQKNTTKNYPRALP